MIYMIKLIREKDCFGRKAILCYKTKCITNTKSLQECKTKIPAYDKPSHFTG